VTATGSVPALDWVRQLPEPKRVAWLAFVDFALAPYGKDIEQSGYVKPLSQRQDSSNLTPGTPSE
jgi:hypothetical protein